MNICVSECKQLYSNVCMVALNDGQIL